MVTTDKPLLLLGEGYTLSRFLERTQGLLLTAVITTNRSILDFSHPRAAEQLDDLLTNQHFSCVIDSVPPPLQDSSSGALLESYQAYIARIAQHTDRLLYLSTTGVFGRTDGSCVDESTSLQPQHPRAAARVKVEEAYRSAFGDTGRFCALRLPAIYGPGRGIGLALQQGRYHLIGDGSRFTNRIHVDDICSTLLALICEEAILPSCLCVCDDDAATQRDVVEFYCTKFGLPYPHTISLEEAQQRLDPLMLGNQRVSNALLKQLYLQKLQFPSFREGAGQEF